MKINEFGLSITWEQYDYIAKMDKRITLAINEHLSATDVLDFIKRVIHADPGGWSSLRHFWICMHGDKFEQFYSRTQSGLIAEADCLFKKISDIDSLTRYCNSQRLAKRDAQSVPF